LLIFRLFSLSTPTHLLLSFLLARLGSFCGPCYVDADCLPVSMHSPLSLALILFLYILAGLRRDFLSSVLKSQSTFFYDFRMVRSFSVTSCFFAPLLWGRPSLGQRPSASFELYLCEPPFVFLVVLRHRHGWFFSILPKPPLLTSHTFFCVLSVYPLDFFFFFRMPSLGASP